MVSNSKLFETEKLFLSPIDPYFKRRAETEEKREGGNRRRPCHSIFTEGSNARCSRFAFFEYEAAEAPTKKIRLSVSVADDVLKRAVDAIKKASGERPDWETIKAELRVLHTAQASIECVKEAGAANVAGILVFKAPGTWLLNRGKYGEGERRREPSAAYPRFEPEIALSAIGVSPQTTY